MLRQGRSQVVSDKALVQDFGGPLISVAAQVDAIQQEGCLQLVRGEPFEFGSEVAEMDPLCFASATADRGKRDYLSESAFAADVSYLGNQSAAEQAVAL